MSFVDANFVALCFVSCFAGITSTVSGYAEIVPYGFADVAHMRHFEMALRSSTPEWYRDGMLLSAYEYNGYTWRRKHLTWAIVRESNRVDTARVAAAAGNAFAKWTDKTPFRFSPIDPNRSRRPVDIKISIGSDGEPPLYSDTIFPLPQGELDGRGVTIVLNEDLEWTGERGTRNWCNLEFAMLYEVTRCLGLTVTIVPGSLMDIYWYRRYKIDDEYTYNLGQDDIDGIRALYHFDRPSQATNGFGRGHHPHH